MPEGGVQLRRLAREHLAQTLIWANDPDLMVLLDRAHPVTEAEHAAWFERISASPQCAYFAIETEARRHIGNVWLWDIDTRHRRAEVRIVIGDTAGTDRGWGTSALDQISAIAFDRLDLHKVCAYVLALNPRAKRAFEKAGFVAEGLLRADRRTRDGWVDVHVLGRLRDDAPAPAR